MSKPLRILVTNDDGVNAPGMRMLAKALQEIAPVVIVAPDRDRSGASHSLTLSSPLYVNQVEDNVYSIQGTPTDCAHLALTGLLPKAETPDIVVSGINAGAIMGDDVIYSGTVGAALEGRFLGLPAIAVSLVGQHKHYETAATVVQHLLKHLIENLFDNAATLNVNVPDVPLDQIKGFEVTRLGSRHLAEPAVKQTDPRGRDIYWIGAAGHENDASQGTDFYAVRHNYVSITPLNVDLTCYKSFDDVAHWLKDCKI
jgi:5'-nucleotidase